VAAGAGAAECQKRSEEGAKMRILVNEELERKEWNEFVFRNPRGNIFQTYEMYEVYTHTKNFEALIVAAEDKGIVGGALVYISTELPGMLAGFSTRAVLQGGPLGNYSLVQEELDKRLRGKALFLQVRNICGPLRLNGFHYEPHLNFILDLRLPEEDLWKRLSKDRRHGINKSSREGLKIVKINSAKELATVYRLLESTYSNANQWLADISLFHGAYELLGDNAHFYLANVGKEAIGTTVILTYKKTAYGWYAGSDRSYRKYYPNDALSWHAILDAKRAGFERYDFGGAGHPDRPYGVREFKRQFGGEEVNYCRCEKVYSPSKFLLAKFGYEIVRRIPRLV